MRLICAGVRSVAIAGDRNHLVVSGVGVDSVELTRSLRRIFEYAHIVSVRNIGETWTEESCFRSHDFMSQNHYHHQPSYNYIAVPVYDSHPPPYCSIMWFYSNLFLFLRIWFMFWKTDKNKKKKKKKRRRSESICLLPVVRRKILKYVCIYICAWM